MQKIFFFVFSTIFILASCKNEPAPQEQNESTAVAVKAANFQEQETAPIEISDPKVAEPTAPDTKEKEMSAEKEKTTMPPLKKEEVKKVTASVSAEKVEKKEAPQMPEKTTPPPTAPEVEEGEMVTLEDDEDEPAVVDMTPTAPVPSHAAWDALLRKYVSSSGKVDYAGFKNEKGKLEAYIKTLQDNPPVDGDWSRKEKLAYWINVYNAFTVKLIVDNYPVSSITKLEGGKPWDKKWIKIGGKTHSLNNVENDIIRPRFNEPRIHFAVNCAAKSCPPLLNRAWTAANLESNFAKQAKSFINNSKYNTISADKIQVSKIFEWYKEDFGNLINYLNKFSETKINSGAKIEFLEYDWSLNN